MTLEVTGRKDIPCECFLSVMIEYNNLKGYCVSVNRR